MGRQSYGSPMERLGMKNKNDLGVVGDPGLDLGPAVSKLGGTPPGSYLEPDSQLYLPKDPSPDSPWQGVEPSSSQGFGAPNQTP